MKLTETLGSNQDLESSPRPVLIPVGIMFRLSKNPNTKTNDTQEENQSRKNL